MTPAISRREFIRRSAFAAVLAPCLAAAADDSRRPLRIRLQAPDASPLDAVRRETLIARDLGNDTVPLEIAPTEEGAVVRLAEEAVQFACRLEVPGFGEVYCYADNGGRGYLRPGTIEFVVEAARTPLPRGGEAYARERSELVGDPVFTRHLEAAAQPLPAQPEAARVAAAYASLAHGLHAGERLTLVTARRRIARLTGPRREFLFGALVWDAYRAPTFERRFTSAFNFGAVHWYRWGAEQPESGRIDYAPMDASLQWCLRHHVVPKGYGYVYLWPGAVPEWLRSWPYEKVLAEYRRVVAQTTRRYAGRLPYVEVINEAHDKSNLLHFSHAQILELTRESCRAAREGSPTVKRLINHCCLWAEYAKKPNDDGSRRWSPFRYLADCARAGVEFERIGLQLYYPQQDLFEIDRMLDRFKAFGRPLQISEMSCNSAPGLDPASLRPKSLVPGWHGPWTESMQADWAEAIYTLAYSKPEFEAAGWWDVADYGGHFWPHGGLLRRNYTPKEAYRRLRSLQQSWGLMGAAGSPRPTG